jgi:PEP-CTERM motif
MKNSGLVLLSTIFMLFVLVTPSFADTVYSNLGPGSTYDPGVGLQVCGSAAVCLQQSIADSFTVPAGPGYNLTQLDVAVTNVSGTNSAIIKLLTNSGGSPSSTVLGSWTLTNVPATLSVSSIQPSQTISGISGIGLIGGTQYWLAAFPGASDTADSWMTTSTGAIGRVAFSANGGTAWSPTNSIQEAFDVLGTPLATATPEPGTLTLLGCGLLGLAVLFRRK